MNATQPVLDVALEPKDQPAALPATVAGSDPALAMIERFASDPAFDVTKLQALMEMRYRELARVAEQAFNAAMSAAQTDMKPVAADADNTQTLSRYASYAALDRALRPIYTKYGFGLSFDTTDAPHAEYVRVLCYVTHVAGHSRTYRADMPADGKGAKGGDVMTKTHAAGSAMSYGMRYLLKMIFNVAVGEDDDDGNLAGGSLAKEPETPRPAVPEGVHWIVRCEDLGGRGKKKGNIHFSNGVFATVWAQDSQLFDLCSDLMQRVKPVTPKLQHKEGYAPTLKGVTVYEFPSQESHEGANAPEPELAIEAKDIPF